MAVGRITHVDVGSGLNRGEWEGNSHAVGGVTGGKIVRGATVIVAANDASEASKTQADWVCDGTADEIQVQGAYDALSSTNTTGCIQLTEGNFYFADEFNTGTTAGGTNHHVWLRGMGKGTQIHWTTGGTYTGKYMFKFGASASVRVQRLTISDMHLTGGAAAVTGGGGIIGYFAGGDITRLKMDSFNEYALTCGDGSAGVRIYGNNLACDSSAVNGASIYLVETGDSWIVDNNIGVDNVANTQHGLYLHGYGGASASKATQSIFISRNFFNQVTHGIYGDDVANLLIDDNIFNNSQGNCIRLFNDTAVNMENIKITGNLFSGWASDNVATGYAVFLTPKDATNKAERLHITDNIFDEVNGAAHYAISFTAVDRYSNGIVADNHFEGHTVDAVIWRPTGVRFRDNTNYSADLFTIPVMVVASDTALTTGDEKLVFNVPEIVDGANLTGVHAFLSGAVSTSGAVSVMLHNLTDGSDMLSTPATVDQGEWDSHTAAAAAVVDTNEDDVVKGDRIRVDVDGAGTNVKGLNLETTWEIST